MTTQIIFQHRSSPAFWSSMARPASSMGGLRQPLQRSSHPGNGSLQSGNRPGETLKKIENPV